MTELDALTRAFIAGLLLGGVGVAGVLAALPEPPDTGCDWRDCAELQNLPREW